MGCWWAFANGLWPAGFCTKGRQKADIQAQKADTKGRTKADIQAQKADTQGGQGLISRHKRQTQKAD